MLNETLRISKRIAIVAAAATLAACSHGIQISQHAVDYNKSLENSENRTLLLNIIRAAKKRPMHFTRLESVSSTLKSSISLSPKISLGKDSSEDFGNGLMVSASSSPTIAYKALLGEKFYKAIFKPVKPDLFDLFRDQGWHTNDLLNIFVERVEIYRLKKDGTRENIVCVIDNNPHIPENLAAFNAFLEFLGDGFKKKTSTVLKYFGPPLTPSEINDAKSLKKLKDTGLSLVEEKDRHGRKTGRYRLATKVTTSAYFVRSATVFADSLARLKAQIARQKNHPDLEGQCIDRNKKDLENDIEFLKAAAKENASIRRKMIKKRGGTVKLEADVKLRSIQAMIYYLGQLTRVDIGGGKYAAARAFKVNKNWSVVSGRAAKSAISVRYDGVRYAIPDHSGKTLTYFALVRQLFALRDETSPPPSPQQPLRLTGG